MILDGKMANGQNVEEAIIGNSYTKVFFGLDNKGVDDLTKKLRMTFSEKEKKLLESQGNLQLGKYQKYKFLLLWHFQLEAFS